MLWAQLTELEPELASRGRHARLAAPAVPPAVPVTALVLLAVIVGSTARQGAPSHALCIRIHRQGRVGDPAVWPPMLNVSLCD